MPVNSLVVLLVMSGAFSAFACRRQAIVASTEELKAVVVLVNARQELRSYSIEKVEVERDHYSVFLEDGKKSCKLAFKVSSDPACKASVEPIQKIECP